MLQRLHSCLFVFNQEHEVCFLFDRNVHLLVDYIMTLHDVGEVVVDKYGHFAR